MLSKRCVRAKLLGLTVNMGSFKGMLWYRGSWVHLHCWRVPACYLSLCWFRLRMQSRSGWLHLANVQ
jgi:hypothetical protein